MISSTELGKLAQTDIGSVNTDELVEIDRVCVNRRLPKQARVLRFIEEVKNPYCFKVDGSVVKTCFSDSGLSLQDALVKYAMD